MNALSVELGIERRTLAKRLTGLTPADERRIGQRIEKRWRLAAVFDCLNGHEDTGKRASNLDVERARLARMQADRIETDLAKLHGQLLPFDQVASQWAARTIAFRAKMLALPSKTARVLASLEDFKEIASVLREEIEEALRELVREELESIAKEERDDDPTGAAAAGPEAVRADRRQCVHQGANAGGGIRAQASGQPGTQ